MLEPTTFFIILTNKCNLNCQHCYAPKNNIEMSDEVLKLATQYVIDNIREGSEQDYVVNFTGGELGLYNQYHIISSITEIIHSNTSGKNIRFIHQSNFVYDLTPAHIQALLMMDEIATSFDAGNIRFRNRHDEMLWRKNLKTVTTMLNKPVRLSIVATTEMIKIPPKFLLGWVMELGVHILEVNSMLPPLSGKNVDHINPSTGALRAWLFELWKEYEEIRKVYDLTIPDFECIRDSFYGKNYWLYARECCNRNRTIMADGKVATCMLTQNKPIYDLVENKPLADLNNWCTCENTLPAMCESCEYLKYCKGGCQFYRFDSEGCATPKDIYAYLIAKEELLNG